MTRFYWDVIALSFSDPPRARFAWVMFWYAFPAKARRFEAFALGVAVLFSVAASYLLWDALRSAGALAWLVGCALSSASALRVYEAITEGA